MTAASRRPPDVGGIGGGCIVATHRHYGQRPGMSRGMACRGRGCVTGGMAGHSLVGVRGRRVDRQGEGRSMRGSPRAGDRRSDGWDSR
jgi:hypothetical protein